ncbi:MAG: C25 family cysteine peptidase [Candidatus Eisenbacteria bacterium]
MEGYGYFMVPGKPALPMKRFLIALPPGARAQSVEVLSTRTTTVPGTHEIEPFPPMLPLVDPPGFEEAMREMNREWAVNNNAVYHSDAPFPEKIAWMAGAGTLRKYSYASVSFCPLAYHPQSGRLSIHNEADIAIGFTLPEPGGEEAERAGRLLLDRAADEKASRLFANYREIAELYSVDEGAAGTRSETYDYVVITAEGLVGAITSSDFPAWKEALGHSVRIVLITDSEIATQPGTDLTEQIRNFLRNYYATWGIEYVLLVGDYSTVPMPICYPNPANHVYNPNNPGLVAPGTPSDYYYADLSYSDSASWDSDGDGYRGEYSEDDPDFLAEVAVGRIPLNNTTRITYALDKLVDFEQDSGPWKTSALLAGAILFFENQNHGGGPFVDGATCLDSIERGLMSGWNVTHQCEAAGLVSSSFSWSPLTEAGFTNAWRTGEYAIVNWSGHGWPDGAYRTVWEWDDGDGVPESGELNSYQFIHSSTSSLDDDRPSIVFAVSCNVGYPEPNSYGRAGVDLLMRPGWGASAGVVASSRPAAVSGDWMNYPGGTESIGYEFNRYMIAEGERVGDALYNGKFHATTHYGWDHYYEYMGLYTYNLYGDAALAVGGISTDVAAGRPREPQAALRLEPSHPNPFTSTTVVRFSLSAAAPVRAAVYDIRGRKVAGLLDLDDGAGRYELTWDGTNTDGAAVAAGVYFAVVEAGTERAIRKVVRLR